MSTPPAAPDSAAPGPLRRMVPDAGGETQRPIPVAAPEVLAPKRAVSTAMCDTKRDTT